MIELSKLEGRIARCGCGQERPSAHSLPFFQYRGEGSRDAQERCKQCGKYEVAHHPGCSAVSPDQYERHPFEPHGPFEFDGFYCGCSGWD